ncbi:MAG TPA: lipocalin family protein [Pseudomonadales bacterium]
MMWLRIWLLCLAAAVQASEPLPTVPALDLSRYQGDWYEIARLDHWFQRGCTQSSALYRLQDDGTVKVTNRCVMEDGKPREALGQAVPVPERPARFKVSFGFFSRLFTPSDGNYWVIALDDDYRWAMVGHPNRQYLWILSRSPALDDGIRERLSTQAQALGFPVGALRWENAAPNAR